MTAKVLLLELLLVFLALGAVWAVACWLGDRATDRWRARTQKDFDAALRERAARAVRRLNGLED